MKTNLIWTAKKFGRLLKSIMSSWNNSSAIFSNTHHPRHSLCPRRHRFPSTFKYRTENPRPNSARTATSTNPSIVATSSHLRPTFPYSLKHCPAVLPSYLSFWSKPASVTQPTFFFPWWKPYEIGMQICITYPPNPLPPFFLWSQVRIVSFCLKSRV